MERNHICKKCGGIAGWDSYFQSWICTRCRNEEPKSQTNYDRIHAMNVEELAEWMVQWTDCYECVARTKGCCQSDESCASSICNWLKREVE